MTAAASPDALHVLKTVFGYDAFRGPQAEIVRHVAGGGNAALWAPSMAFMSVLVAGQLAGSFAWLAVAAEDAPELLTAAPVFKGALDRVKLFAALAMAAALALILPAVMAPARPLAAVVTLAMTALGGLGAAGIEVALAKASPRATFAKRRQGGIVAGLLAFVITGACGAVAGAATYALG